MAQQRLCSPHSLGDHALVKVRVAFAADDDRTFYESVGELVEAIGVRKDTSLAGAADHRWDLHLVNIDEDDYSSPGARRGTAEFAVPTGVLPVDGAVPLMLSIATYGSVYRFVREYQVIDLEFPSEAMSQHDLCGPQRGPEFISPRDAAARLGAIIKPRFISDESNLRQLVRALASAEIDYLADDELTVGTPDLSFERRVGVVTTELEACAATTGRQIPYIANITGSYAGAMRRARAAADLGARGVMVNTIAMGYDVVSDLANDDGFDLGIVANSIGRGVLTSGPGYRVAPELLCKLARLVGADAVYTGPLVGDIATVEQHAERYLKVLTQPYHGACVRRPAAAMMSGGVGLPEIIRNEQLYRGDLFLSMGREFMRPLADGLDPSVLVHCIRAIWGAVRDGGREAGREMVERLHGRRGSYPRYLQAIRAEEAVA